MTPCERALRRRVAALVLEVMNERGMTYADVGLRGATLGAILHERSDVKLGTLVRVAEALHCDVILNFRDRR